jgi:hypothetical protein
MLSFTNKPLYGEFHYAECHAECRGAQKSIELRLSACLSVLDAYTREY